MSIGRSVSAWWGGIVASLLLAAAPVLGGEPAVIVSVKPFNELASDAQYLVTATNQPQLGTMLPMLLAQAFGGQPPKGFDASKPIVGYVSLSPTGQPDGGALCIPVTNAKDFAAALAALAQTATTEGEITTYQLPFAPVPVVGKAVAKHYLLTILPDALQDAPDPDKLTKSTADLAVEIDLSRIPENLKEMFLAQAEAGVTANRLQITTEAERKELEFSQKFTLAGLRRLILDGDRLGINLNVDPASKTVSVDLAFTSKSGTTLAAACNNFNKTASPFSGLVSPQAVVSLLISAPMSEEAREMYNLAIEHTNDAAQQRLDAIKNDSKPDLAALRTFLSQLTDSLMATNALGRVDQAVVVNQDGSGKVQIVLAQKVAKGKELASEVEKLLAKVKKDGKAPGEVKLGVATVAGGRVHSMKFPPAVDSPIAEGPAHFLVTNDVVWVVIGGDSLAALKKALEAKPVTTPAPIALRVNVSKLLPTLPAASRVPESVSQAAFAAGGDEVSLQVRGQASGALLRLEIQEGVLKLIGLATNRVEGESPDKEQSRRDEPKAEKKPAAGNPGEFRRFTDMRWGVKSLAFSPAAGLLAAGRPDQALTLFDVANDSRLDGVDKLKMLKSVTSCLFTPDGSHLLAGGGSGHIQIYDVSQEGRLKESGQFAGHSKEVSCMAVSGDGKWAVSGGKEKTLRFWEVDTGREQAAFPGCEGPIKACFIAKNGRTALATDGATLLSIDLKKKEITRRGKLARSWAAGQAAAFSADGEQVAVGDGNTVRLWSIKTQAERPKLEDNEIQWSMTFTPDGTRLISGGHGKVNVWDVRKRRKLQAIAVAGNGYIQSLAVSPDNKYVAAIPSSAGQDLQVFRLGKAE